MHADLLDFRKLTRIMTEVVILLQEKNILAEAQGKKFVKVGMIERHVKWPIEIKRVASIVRDDFYSKKLRQDIQEQGAFIAIVEREAQTAILINKEMKAFVSAVFGNDFWIKEVENNLNRSNFTAKIP